MKKSLLTALFFLLIVCGTYAKHKKHKQTKLTQDNKIEYVEMSHGACFGKCPIYTIAINKNGLMTYTGIKFVKDSGIYEKNIGSLALNLLEKFNYYRVDTCPREYVNKIPDLSGIFYKIKYSDSTKFISNIQYGPDFLKTLTTTIDSMGKVDNTWKKTKAVRNK